MLRSQVLTLLSYIIETIDIALYAWKEVKGFIARILCANIWSVMVLLYVLNQAKCFAIVPEEHGKAWQRGVAFQFD